jgi:hypothetical protein
MNGQGFILGAGMVGWAILIITIIGWWVMTRGQR